MFRRTLLVFLAIVVLCLALTVGYAIVGLSGPKTALADARRAFEDGRYRDSVRLCTLAEDGIGPNSSLDLQREILDLRHRANLELENIAPALDDLDRLRSLVPDDREIAVRQIRWSISNGDIERSLRLAQTLRADEPDDGEVLEVTGNAFLASHREKLDKLESTITSTFDPKTREAALVSLREWLFGDRLDPRTEGALTKFRAILERDRPEIYADGRYAAQLEEIRQLLDRSQELFRQALERTDNPIDAYRGVVYALREGRRKDDLLAHAMIHRDRFQRPDSIEPVVDLVSIFLERGQYREIAQIAERYLPLATWREQLDQGLVDSRIKGLFLTAARAYSRLSRRDRLEALATAVNEMQDSGLIDLMPEYYMVRALAGDQETAPREVDREVRIYTRALAEIQPQTPEVLQERRLTTAFHLLLGIRAGFGKQFFVWRYRDWSQFESRSIAPIIQLVRFLLDRGEADEARVRAESERARAGQDEEFLRVYARTLDASAVAEGRDAESLLASCLRLGVTLPPTAQDVQYLTVAALALERGHPDIGLACAERATRAYSWALWPRQLEIQAAFDLNDPKRALRAAEALIAFHPTSPEGLRGLLQARSLLGLPTDDLYFELLLSGQRDAQVAQALLQRASARDDQGLAAMLAKTIKTHYGQDPRALLMVAGEEHKQGRLNQALKTLRRASEIAALTEDAIFGEAFRRYFLMAVLVNENPAELRELTRLVLTNNEHDATQLFALAQKLAQLDKPLVAYHMLLPVVIDDIHRERRTGEHYLLAGRLALQIGLVADAERHLLAAVTFDDRGLASRLLSLMFLDQGRPEDSARSYWESEVLDLTSACLSAMSGKRASAATWARQRVRESRWSVTARCVLAVTAPNDDNEPRILELAKAEPELLLETMAFLEQPEFRGSALSRAERLVIAAPENPFAEYLVASALAQAGRSTEALERFNKLVKAKPLGPDRPFIAAYDAAVEILDRSTDLIGANLELLQDIVEIEDNTDTALTDRMRGVAARTRAAKIQAALGNGKAALEELARGWTAFPGAASVNLEKVELLRDQGLPAEAIRLAEALEKHLPPADRQRFAGIYFDMLRERLKEDVDSALLTRGASQAHTICDNELAYPSTVWFLIEYDRATNGPKVDREQDQDRVARLVGLIDRSITQTAAGKIVPDARSLLAIIDEVVRFRNTDAALLRSERLLRADPSLINVWQRRSRWLYDSGERQAALSSLRWIYHYLPNHKATLEALTWAAADNQLTTDDRDALLSMPEYLKATKRGRLLQGLVAFRDNQAEEAAVLLMSDASDGQGLRQYFAALSQLELGRPTAARDLFDQLANAYPRSSWSENAGHFSRVLAH